MARPLMLAGDEFTDNVAAPNSAIAYAESAFETTSIDVASLVTHADDVVVFARVCSGYTTYNLRGN